MILYTDIDPFCCQVLRARVADGGLPKGDVLEKDIREITEDDLAGYRQIHLFAGIGGFGLAQKWSGFEGEIVTGGFPCQDISVAGRGEGIEGSRSGLWSEMSRIIGVIRPRFVLVENVAALLGRGLSRVLGDLAALGYDAEWHCIPASAVGAPHRRDRVWIVAYPGCELSFFKPAKHGASPEEQGSQGFEWNQEVKNGEFISLAPRNTVWDGDNRPEICRMDDGLPNRLDRIASLGNAIVPQVATVIMQAMSGAQRTCQAPRSRVVC